LRRAGTSRAPPGIRRRTDRRRRHHSAPRRVFAAAAGCVHLRRAAAIRNGSPSARPALSAALSGKHDCLFLVYRGRSGEGSPICARSTDIRGRVVAGPDGRAVARSNYLARTGDAARGDGPSGGHAARAGASRAVAAPIGRLGRGRVAERVFARLCAWHLPAERRGGLRACAGAGGACDDRAHADHGRRRPVRRGRAVAGGAASVRRSRRCRRRRRRGGDARIFPLARGPHARGFRVSGQPADA
jgi:hypothetical protein